MTQLKWNQFGSIEDVPQLMMYLDGRQYNHERYFHYTSLKAIDGILGTRTFRISNVSRFNDHIDRKQFDTPQFYFSLCFSTGINENLPLWYLYAGLTGHGGRIGFTDTAMKDMLKSAVFELAEYDDNDKPVVICTLEDGINMEKNFRDVLYCGGDTKENLSLKYNTMTNYKIPAYQKEKLKMKYNGFLKGLIWYYEKETRLLIRVTGRAAKKIKPDKKYCVLMHFSEKNYKSAQLTFAPEVVDIPAELAQYDAIRKYVMDTSKISASKFQGEIEMKLCDSCTRNAHQNPSTE